MLLGGVCSKSAFSKKKFFLREDFFETNLNLNKHPQQVFWFFSPIFFLIFFQKNNPHILEELRQFCAKFHDFLMKIRGETRVQSWTFFALFFRKRIVHCGAFEGGNHIFYPFVLLQQIKHKMFYPFVLLHKLNTIGFIPLFCPNKLNTICFIPLFCSTN